MRITYFTDLEVYRISEDLAMKIFEVTKKFPVEEKYSLSDQIRRSSRSVSANIAEGWGKKYYSGLFKRRLVDSLGSLEETRSWLRFAYKCKYIDESIFLTFTEKYNHLGSKLYILYRKWN